MASFCQTYKWDTTPEYTDRFSFTTKYYTFGSVQIPKTIYAISVTIGMPDKLITSGYNNMITIAYRTTLDVDFQGYGYLHFTKPGLKTVRIKIEKADGLQLKIGGFLATKSYINDISIEFRPTKKKNIGTER